MDEVSVDSVLGLGTKITMKKMIKKDEISEEEINEEISGQGGTRRVVL